MQKEQYDYQLQQSVAVRRFKHDLTNHIGVLRELVNQKKLEEARGYIDTIWNVQDEFEHNLAQRLYVSESTWQLIVMAKEEVLQNVNAVFNDNPDADIAMIAQKIASFENPMGEKAVINIKNEFNSL